MAKYAMTNPAVKRVIENLIEDGSDRPYYWKWEKIKAALRREGFRGTDQEVCDMFDKLRFEEPLKEYQSIALSIASVAFREARDLREIVQSLAGAQFSLNLAVNERWPEDKE